MFEKVTNSKFSVVALTLMGSAFLGCSVSQNKTTESIESPICSYKPQTQNSLVTSKIQKVLFIVDKSGSNANQSGGTGLVGNDPLNTKRAGSIEDYIEDKLDNPSYQWGFIGFGVEMDKAQAWINSGLNTNGIFGDTDQLLEALRIEKSTPDNGCTPYLAALSLAKKTISEDLARNSGQDSVYNIFFVSDGYPTDSKCQNVSIQQVSSDPHIQAVNGLKSLAPQKIYLSTVYYAEKNNDPSRVAAEGLRYMASVGGGNFIDLSSNGKINFASLQVFPNSGDSQNDVSASGTESGEHYCKVSP